MNPTSAADHLITAVAIIKKHGPPDLAEWLESGINDHLRHGKPLEQSVTLARH